MSHDPSDTRKPVAATVVDDDSYVDLTDTPTDTTQLAVWRAKRFARSIEEGMRENVGPHVALQQVDVYDAGFALSFDVGDDKIETAYFFDPDRIHGHDPETGDINPGPMQHLILRHEDGYGAVFEGGDVESKPRLYKDMTVALERTLARPELNHLAAMTDQINANLASEKFDRRVPAHAYPAPRMMQ